MKTLDHVTKLSQLLEVAVRDMKMVKANPRYVFHVSSWHTPAPDNRCVVCVAGAIMAGELGADPNMKIDPYNLPDRDLILLHAIDDIRQGVILKGVGFPRLFDIFGYTQCRLTALQDIIKSYHSPALEAGEIEAWENLAKTLKEEGY